MSFTVSARTADREIKTQHVSGLAALERAFILAGSGMTEVAITDHRGRIHTPTELARLMLGERPAADAVRPVARRAAA